MNWVSNRFAEPVRFVCSSFHAVFDHIKRNKYVNMSLAAGNKWANKLGKKTWQVRRKNVFRDNFWNCEWKCFEGFEAGFCFWIICFSLFHVAQFYFQFTGLHFLIIYLFIFPSPLVTSRVHDFRILNGMNGSIWYNVNDLEWNHFKIWPIFNLSFVFIRIVSVLMLAYTIFGCVLSTWHIRYWCGWFECYT